MRMLSHQRNLHQFKNCMNGTSALFSFRSMRLQRAACATLGVVCKPLGNCRADRKRSFKSTEECPKPTGCHYSNDGDFGARNRSTSNISERGLWDVKYRETFGKGSSSIYFFRRIYPPPWQLNSISRFLPLAVLLVSLQLEPKARFKAPESESHSPKSESASAPGTLVCCRITHLIASQIAQRCRFFLPSVTLIRITLVLLSRMVATDTLRRGHTRIARTKACPVSWACCKAVMSFKNQLKRGEVKDSMEDGIGLL